MLEMFLRDTLQNQTHYIVMVSTPNAPEGLYYYDGVVIMIICVISGVHYFMVLL
jgi:hypothetical protein